MSHGHRLALVLLCALAACSSTIDRRRMRADLEASAPDPDGMERARWAAGDTRP